MTESELGSLESRRGDFLLAMYKAMWDNINRHILVVWQSMTALLAALGAAYLSGKGVIDPDLAVDLVLLAAAWSVAHAIDSKGWFNRNLLIITNIERLFLRREDARLVHDYFRRPHRSGFIEHLSIQAVFAVAVVVVVLVQHFAARVVPGFALPLRDLSVRRCVPYVLVVVCAALLCQFNRKVNRQLAKLRVRSPGLDTSPS